MIEVAALFSCAAIAGLWYDIMRARETAVDAARRVCDAAGVQLLDDTVAVTALALRRRADGRITLRRVYRFEFSDTGNNRLPGSLTLLGRVVEGVHLEKGGLIAPRLPETT
jgi:hypothetical protein